MNLKDLKGTFVCRICKKKKLTLGRKDCEVCQSCGGNVKGKKEVI